MKASGALIGFGTDLLGVLETNQCREFSLRSEVFSPVEILRQATSQNAKVLRREGQIGVVRPDADADLIALKGNPLNDLSLFTDDGKNVSLIIQRGKLHKCALGQRSL